MGDWVFLKFQPYRMRSLARKPNEKLSPKFYEPYQIIEKVVQVAYLPTSNQLLDIRTIGFGATEVLVKWLNLPNCENSWEPLNALKLQFPDSHLEDKVVLLGGEVVLGTKGLGRSMLEGIGMVWVWARI